MRSLRGQLTFWLAVLLTLVGLIASIATGYLTFTTQQHLLDDRLRQIALSVGDTPSAADDKDRAATGIRPQDQLVVRILRLDGSLVRNSDTTADIPFSAVTGFASHMDGDITWHVFTLVTDKRIIQVAQDFDVRQEAVWGAVLSTALPILLIIPLSWLVVGWIVRRLLASLKSLSREVETSLAAHPITLPEQELPVEVIPLVRAVNGLLARQHDLLKFRERFISDAAHQLRTPVAALDLQLQNLQQELAGQQGLAVLDPPRHGLRRISLLLSQLLNLARAETPVEKQPPDSDIETACRTAIADMIDLAALKGIDLGLVVDQSCSVAADATDIEMIIRNLLENAIRHTPHSGTIDVEITATQDGKPTIIVRDTGPGLPNEVLNRVFDRFYRYAPTDSKGSGLGLAIVQALAQRMGAQVSLRNRHDASGLEAIICFT